MPGTHTFKHRHISETLNRWEDMLVAGLALDPFLLGHKMSVLLNVIILTCKVSLRVTEGGCQHWALLKIKETTKK